ncbi:biotin-dependent carboxyltransferase family protein [Alterisphingorhabdus coralli]|uniref:Biotin-dependent carboxyltransferase family protein n=1 Tax=Alterisphingorhabdus coralli TaxID=3071408 RepID=A0AA97F5E0_9SPHN|nr:biotin-dependent carboxyltransferase family protein [Parasphingorhabdus sp. SCSIO 66989]WOE74326.1 biotin-dependent carboxyltransferase family protein [Parasphingorhabdus sp. SCSIO 66989]
MSDAALVIDQPGLAMSIQGRPWRNMRHQGVPLAGPADPIACAIANWLAGNPAGSPALEWAVSRFSGHATTDMVVGVAGAAGNVVVNAKLQDSRKSIRLAAGDHFSISPSRHGARLYLGVAGGFAVDTILGATSTYAAAGLGTAADWPMEHGDSLPLRTSAKPVADRILPQKARQSCPASYVLRYVTADAASDRSDNASPASSWLVTSRFDRAAVQLRPEPPENMKHFGQSTSGTMPSNAVFTGTIQLPPDGEPLLMGVDSRTTGGYTIAGQIIRADRHLLGQLRSGDKVELIATSAEKAREIYAEKLELWRRYLPDLRLD